MTKIKQVIFVRNDLKTFSKGAIAAQAVQAAVKAIEVYKEDLETKNYINDINNMTKLILKFTENDTQNIISFLNAKYDFVEWIENPEQILTAIAMKPCLITKDLDIFLRKYKLY